MIEFVILHNFGILILKSIGKYFLREASLLYKLTCSYLGQKHVKLIIKYLGSGVYTAKDRKIKELVIYRVLLSPFKAIMTLIVPSQA